MERDVALDVRPSDLVLWLPDAGMPDAASDRMDDNGARGDDGQ